MGTHCSCNKGSHALLCRSCSKLLTVIPTLPARNSLRIGARGGETRGTRNGREGIAGIHTNRTHQLTKPGFWSLENGRKWKKWG